MKKKQIKNGVAQDERGNLYQTNFFESQSDSQLRKIRIVDRNGQARKITQSYLDKYYPGAMLRAHFPILDEVWFDRNEDSHQLIYVPNSKWLSDNNASKSQFNQLSKLNVGLNNPHSSSLSDSSTDIRLGNNISQAHKRFTGERRTQSHDTFRHNVWEHPLYEDESSLKSPVMEGARKIDRPIPHTKSELLQAEDADRRAGRQANYRYRTTFKGRDDEQFPQQLKMERVAELESQRYSGMSSEEYAAIQRQIDDVNKSPSLPSPEDNGIPSIQSATRRRNLSNIQPAEGRLNNPDFGKPADKSTWPTNGKVNNTIPPIQSEADPLNNEPLSAPVEEENFPPAPVLPPPPSFEERLRPQAQANKVDSRNNPYIKARGQLTSNSSQAEVKQVEDMGMEIWRKANPTLAARSSGIPSIN